jgi:hypothetical protein
VKNAFPRVVKKGRQDAVVSVTPYRHCEARCLRCSRRRKQSFERHLPVICRLAV